MANTYSRIYLQIVFAVKYRQALLDIEWREDVFKYITGIINRHGHYSLAGNGYDDHIHIFLDYRGHQLISDIVREIEKASIKFVYENNFCHKKFQWQSGYGVFSHGQNEKEKIIEYVKNQNHYHHAKSFEDEYMQVLNNLEIAALDEYNFNFHDLT